MLKEYKEKRGYGSHFSKEGNIVRCFFLNNKRYGYYYWGNSKEKTYYKGNYNMDMKYSHWYSYETDFQYYL